MATENDRPKLGLLDLPPEIRLVIYGYALRLDFALHKSRNKKQSHLITDCFNLMQTCRTVHDEASPIFWGDNWFAAHAAPTFGLWPRPDVREEDRSIQFDSKNNPWITRVGVESAESQKMIRRLCWLFPDDPWYIEDERWVDETPAVLSGYDIVSSNLSNVRELRIVLESRSARAVHYPTLDEVESLIHEGEFDAEVLEGLDRRAYRLIDAETITNATVHAVRHFAFETLPNIRAVVFIGEKKLSKEGRTWYGKTLTAFPSDCLYLKRIREAFKDTDKLIEYGGVYET